ncbi:flagellar biosynthesis protein FlhB [Pleomorphomonas oryzae]|uniref:flagellar biosynthesis protein FlhB n=1 Tax=Pleomorphomonas oryzae TaxID=261934 RepID=UPI00040E5572|nr:flagellar biosynthesis protein FlhB [Pleomorphomonas oryzae]
MSDEPDQDSKTEEATPKKTQDAIEKGNIATSRELPVLFSLGAMLIVMIWVIGSGSARLAATLRGFLDNPGDVRLEQGQDAVLLLNAVGLEMGRFLVPAIIIFMVAGLAGSFVQNVPQVVFDRIKPELGRLSIAKGWKRLFGLQSFVEFGKALFKFGATALVVSIILKTEQHRMVNAMFSDPGTLVDSTVGIAIHLLSAVCIATVLLVAADLIWARIQWRRNLRMTKQEVKDEFKNTEGDPLVKARMRSLARDRIRHRMMANVPRATLVLANPTHYAIALRYVYEEGGAPVVLAKGQDLVALKIREIAEQNGIPVVEDKLLTRAMYGKVELDQMIPVEFYRAVAEIIYLLQVRSSDSHLPAIVNGHS